jgi:phosphonate transport system substrate-binding protein
LLLLPAGVGLAAASAPFIVGVPPIQSMRILAERFEPLRSYLEVRLGQPVYLESASTFAGYQTRTLHGDFDLTITPSHFARLAQKERRFQPVVQFQPDHDVLLIYCVDHPLTHLSLLKNRELAVIDRLAVMAMASLRYLDDQGLEAGRDFRVVEYRNHVGVAQALVSGTALVGVTTTQGLKQMPEALRKRLKVSAHLADFPGFVMLAKPEASREEVGRLEGYLLAFAWSNTGQEFLKRVASTALTPPDETSLKRTDAYLKETKRGLAQ